MAWNSDLRYGQAITFEHPIVKAGVTTFALAADWTPAAGDVQVIVDGGAPSNITTLPVHKGSGVWTFSLSAAEMQGARITIVVNDTTPKAVEDQAIVLTTEHWNVLATGTFNAGSTPTAYNATMTTADQFKGSFIRATSGPAAGQTSKIASHTTSVITPASGDEFTVAPAAGDSYIIF